MTKGASAETKAALRNPKLRVIYFAALELPGYILRVNSRARPFKIDLDGDQVAEEYLGSGRAGSIAFGDENTEGRPSSAILTLSGIEQEYISAILATKFRGKRGTIWRGYLNADRTLDQMPEIRLRGLLQPQPLTIGEGGLTVSVEITSRLALWERATDAGVWDDQDLQSRRPGDRYHEYAAEIATGKDIVWGRA